MVWGRASQGHRACRHCFGPCFYQYSLPVIQTVFKALLLCCGILCSSGCALVSMSETEKYRDNEGQFEESLFRNIKPGLSTKEWVMTQFGEPLFVVGEGDGVQVYTWHFVKQAQKNTQVLLIFRYRGLKEENRYLHVAVRGSEVLKSWHDTEAHVDLGHLRQVLTKEDQRRLIQAEREQTQGKSVPTMAEPEEPFE